MQSIEKRLTALEAARGKARPYEHLTDVELEERIAALKARSAENDNSTNEGKNHAEH